MNLRQTTVRFMLLAWAVLLFFNLPHYHRGVGFHSSLRLAESFRQGRLDVDPAPDMHDVIHHRGRVYIPFPPGPALLLVPWVALFGPQAHPLWLTPLLGALTAGALFRLYHRFSGQVALSLGLSAAMVFGTAFWPCVRYAFDTYLAHILAVLSIALALLECVGRRRGWLVGLGLGFAVLCRQLTVLGAPFALALLWFGWADQPPPPFRRRWRAPAAAGLVLLAVLASVLVYNRLRFGSFWETGYGWVAEDGWYALRLARWGNFHWAYIPSNLLRLLVMGFSVEFEPPLYMLPVMSGWGTSLTFASPFVFYALWGRLPARRMVNLAGWACCGAITLAVLSHKSAGGGWQVHGLRYTLDFLPILSLFVLAGMQRLASGPSGWLVRASIIYSVGLNLLVIFITHLRTFFPG